MEEEEQCVLRLPTNTKKDLAAVNGSLATNITLWLKKHGKVVRPKLSAEQRQQLKECFELMDQDGSGAIDAEELGAAFKLLGIRMRMSELEELLAEVDHDGSGEVEYLEFLEIMTTTLQRLAEEREADEGSSGEGQVPFALMATAYRRKRLMEGIISGDKEVMQQITQLSERQAAEAANAAVRAASNPANVVRNDEAEVRRMLNSIAKKSLQRLKALHVDSELLMQLPPDERRLLTQIAAKVGSPIDGWAHGTRHARPRSVSPTPDSTLPSLRAHQSPPPCRSAHNSGQQTDWKGTAARTSAPQQKCPSSAMFCDQQPSAGRLPAISNGCQQQYMQKPTHQQLLEAPHVFDLKFSKRTVKLTMAGGQRGALSGALPMPGQTYHRGSSF